MKKIRVVELFAGVGGFRLGLDAAGRKGVRYETVWSSQWEPGAKVQYASKIYERVFGPENHSCEDIQEVVKKKFDTIPDHDLLVGGFPCQDYSVAKTLNQSKGIVGEKGVLWWSIHEILRKKGEKAPPFLMLENVDRLLKSPSTRRGRDFAIMLASLSDLGYAVEWRVINAADYGFPQRRRRVFILGYKKGTKLYQELVKTKKLADWIVKDGVIAKAFPVEKNVEETKFFNIEGDLAMVTKTFSSNGPEKSPFENSGIMLNRRIHTVKTLPLFKGKRVLLGDVLLAEESSVPDTFFIKEGDRKRWEYLKGGKVESRVSTKGFKYNYSEGPMVFPDALDRPSRTVVTGEGGSSPSRFKHVVATRAGKIRRLVPLELERLNMFPDNHTKHMSDGKVTPDIKRAFIMGNALVVGVIKGLGKSLADSI